MSAVDAYSDAEVNRLAEIARRQKPLTYALSGRPPGRPSEYDEAVASVICDLIADGFSLRTICEREDMPHRSTVLRWLDKYAGFAAIYARAREAQADAMDERILAVADASTSESANADRVKIMAYQWRAARLKPKVYGDKLDLTAQTQVTHVVDEVDLAALSPDERDMLRQVAQTLLARKAQALEDRREEDDGV
jgi:hypothetical protein